MQIELIFNEWLVHHSIFGCCCYLDILFRLRGSKEQSIGLREALNDLNMDSSIIFPTAATEPLSEKMEPEPKRSNAVSAKRPDLATVTNAGDLDG
jgi:hypothetical protein